MKATLSRGNGGLYYELDAEDGGNVYIGTDWDYPGLANSLGWDKESLQKIGREHCEHDGTDGTVTCRCGLTADDFIAAAVDWLDEHDGEEFDVPEEYFAEV